LLIFIAKKIHRNWDIIIIQEISQFFLFNICIFIFRVVHNYHHARKTRKFIYQQDKLETSACLFTIYLINGVSLHVKLTADMDRYSTLESGVSVESILYAET